MSIKQVRNERHLPHIEREGIFATELPNPPPFEKNKLWFDKLHPNERLYYYHTLSSARRFANFFNYPDIPKDSLDIVLASEYDHATDFLFKRAEVFTQPETLDKRTFRRLKNQKDIVIKPPVPMSHPKTQGGITERHSIHGVKLMNSGPHTQITNPGYSRQTGDGNFFNY